MKTRRAKGRPITKNWLEWSVFAMGLILVLGVLGYLTAEALAGRREPPSLEIRLGSAVREPAGHVVPVRVRNRGAEAVSDVEVEVALVRAGAPEERNRLTIPLLPGGAEQDGWVVFRGDPADADRLEAHPIGYRRP